jgi:Fe-S cluster assembly protein SufD
MELKEKLVSSFIAFENQISLDNTFVHSMRTEALTHFENIQA